MVSPGQVALSDAADWLGDWHPLAEQLGSAEGLVALGSVSTLLRIGPVQDASSLRHFLRNYQAQIMVPFELPAIQSAHGHAARNELRELVALDQQMASESVLSSFSSASARVGSSQLLKLRPLRDERLVQRYLHAVEAGQARGWHTLVYGVTLAVYSLPLRQGLLGYAHQTLRGFIYSAARVLQFSEKDCRELFDEVSQGLPGAVEVLVRERVAA